MLLFLISASMLIRVPTESQLRKLDYPPVEKRTKEGYEVVVDEEQLHIKLLPSEYTIIIEDLDKYFRSRALAYPTWIEVRDSIYSLANNYPSITKLDTVGSPTYEGRLILALKISDNASIDEDEPELLFEGLHHAREWPAIVMPLFIMDTLITGYMNNVPDIKAFVENLEIWFIPCVNPDGYKYSHDDGNPWWRKNRRYFSSSGTYGVDPNRNHWGYPDTAGEGNWGTPHGASNSPSSETYMGPCQVSEAGPQGIVELRKNHEFIASITYHTYSELVLWPFGHTYDEAPDDDLLSWVGTAMANLISCQSSGTYTPQQSSDLYPTVGDETDFAYGYSLFKLGQMTLPYTLEMCASFAPSESNLPQIIHENFDAVYWLLDNAFQIEDSLKRRERVVLGFDSLPDTVPPNFTVSWHPLSWDPEASSYILREFSDLSYEFDGAESSSGFWIMDGFSRVTSSSHSGSYSFYSNNSGGGYTSLMRTKYPFLSPSAVTYWINYDISTNSHFGYFEISEDGRYWYEVCDYAGNSGGWIEESINLRSFCDSVFGDSLATIFYRFRLCASSTSSDIWIDDITNIGIFGTDTVLDTVSVTSFDFDNHPLGEFYLTVRGENDRGWGDWCYPLGFTVFSGNYPPGKPVLISLFDNASIYNQTPALSFVSTDAEGEDIEYRIFWDTDPNFNNPDSSTTNLFASGNTASFTFTTPLSDNEIYFWRVRARDPIGSGYWSSFSNRRSFSIDTLLPDNTVSWVQRKNVQFSQNTLEGTKIEGDSVILIPGGVEQDTILLEGFEGGWPPSDWTVFKFGTSTRQWEQSSDYAYSGTYSAKVHYDGSDTVDTWLVTKRVDLSSASSCTLSFYQRGNYVTNWYEYWGLFASTSSQTDTSTFTEVVEVGPGIEDAWQEKIVDLSQYCGEDTLYLAFRYKEYNGTDWWVDDITLMVPNPGATDSGRITSIPVVYNWLIEGYDRFTYGWGDIFWEKSSSSDSMGIQLEYLSNGVWYKVPDPDIPSNSSGIFTSTKIGTLGISNLDTLVYDTVRIIGLIYAPVSKASSDPALLSWEIGNLERYAGVTEHTDNKPGEFALFKITPNPIHTTAIFRYAIPKEADVKLAIFDVTGRQVVSLVNRHQRPGYYKVEWNGRSEGGKKLASGVYFIRMDANDNQFTRKAVLIR